MTSRGWAYRIHESLAFGNGRWHELACPFCRGMRRWVREQEAVLAAGWCAIKGCVNGPSEHQWDVSCQSRDEGVSDG